MLWKCSSNYRTREYCICVTHIQLLRGKKDHSKSKQFTSIDCKMTFVLCAYQQSQYRKDYRHRWTPSPQNHNETYRWKTAPAPSGAPFIITNYYKRIFLYSVLQCGRIVAGTPDGRTRPFYLLHLIARDTLKRRVNAYIVYAHIRRYIYIYMYIFIYIYLYTYMCVYMYVYSCACVCVNGTCKRNYRWSHSGPTRA